MTDARYQPKIDPSLRPVSTADLLIDVNDPGNPGLSEWAKAGLLVPDLEIIRDYRLERIREQLRERDVAGALLYDPLNIRYATDTSNMQIWCMHNAVRYCWVATEGPVVLFDFHNCEHLSEDFPRVTETRPATSWFYFGAGDQELHRVEDWADELVELILAAGGENRRICVDKCDKMGIDALQKRGIEIIQSQAFAEEARKIKHPEEIKAMRRAIHTSEVAMAEMWRQLKPGMTENQLWSILHQVNIARGGEWIETRLLASGERTNPWFQECSDRVIEKGDMVAFDTDLVGPYGYCSDISRSWVCDAEPSEEQRELHKIGMEQLTHNIELMKPGMSFIEYGEKSYQLPNIYFKNRYSAVLHGVGLCDEYPHVGYPQDAGGHGYDGMFVPGMCVCFETLIAAEDGREGVKMENQALITDTGVEVLDSFPMDLVPDISDYLGQT